MTPDTTPGDLRVGLGLLTVMRGAAIREGRHAILPALAALESAARADLRAAARLAALPEPTREQFAPTECLVEPTQLAGGFAETLAATQLVPMP